ncbi:PEP/pyruvate-binding domain-containing protein, partial [Azospirillum brasilense]|uniref:PEP/pyruvate-binding domain-containing protein n=1 Tax=Azospirillum brasilense TaxID=192 RepID=UPI003CE46A02
MIEREAGEPFPQDARTQLFAAIGAIFRSWSNARAVAFRAVHGIPDDWGTAATVQAMVFGNRGSASGTGVAHSRDPSTGEAAGAASRPAGAGGQPAPHPRSERAPRGDRPRSAGLLRRCHGCRGLHVGRGGAAG